MRILGLLVLAVLVAGCRPAEQPAAPSTASSTTAAAPAPELRAIASADRLVGEYRIAGADGQGIDLPYGIAATITADRIRVNADCFTLEWSYRFERAALATRRVPAKSCRRSLTPEEQAIAQAFDAATTVMLTEANGYEFVGGGHSVTLFTQ
jgi:hypothetical protein